MSSPKKCTICPIFLLEEGVEEHMRLMHSYSRPSITSQLKSAGPKIREVLGDIRQNKAQERQKMELEELTQKQEQFVVRMVLENKEQEEKEVEMHNDMVEELRSSGQEKEEKLKRSLEERSLEQKEKQKRERSKRRKDLQLEYDKKVEELKDTLEAKFIKDNKEAEEFLQWEGKVWEDAQMESLKKEKEEAEIQLKRRREALDEEKRKRSWNLSRLLKENEIKRKEMLEKHRQETHEGMISASLLIVVDSPDSIEEMRSTRKRKRASVENEEQTTNHPSPPECPVCFTEMAPPTKIFQCSNGHHICESCKSKLDPFKCPKCRKRMIGRATDMENFLSTFCPSPENTTESE